MAPGESLTIWICSNFSGKWQYRNSEEERANLFNWSSFHEGKHWYKVNGTSITATDRARNDAIQFLRHERPKDIPFALTVAFYPPKPVGNKVNPPGAAWDPDWKHRKMYKNITFPEIPYNVSQAFDSLPEFLKKSIARRRWYQRWPTQEHYKHSMRKYHGLVSQVDEVSEEIVEELRMQGILDNTMIIVTADNGLLMGMHGLAGKWFPYQESIRVPLIIHDPRIPISKRGKTRDEFTLNIDLAPTILKAANVEPPSTMNGRDMADLYLGSSDSKQEEEPWRKEFFYEFPLEEFPACTALVRKEWKYMQWPGHKLEQLFDLVNDPYELKDVANVSEHREVLVEMRLRHRQLQHNIQNPANITLPVCKKGDDTPQGTETEPE